VVERSQLRLGRQQAITELTQHRKMKAGVGQVEREGIFPINRPTDGIGGLAVGQTFHKLEDGDQQQAAGRQSGLSDGGKQGGEVLIGAQHAQFVADLHDRTAFGKGGTGDPLGFGGNDVKQLRMHAHAIVLLLPKPARSRAKCALR